MVCSAWWNYSKQVHSTVHLHKYISTQAAKCCGFWWDLVRQWSVNGAEIGAAFKDSEAEVQNLWQDSKIWFSNQDDIWDRCRVVPVWCILIFGTGFGLPQISCQASSHHLQPGLSPICHAPQGNMHCHSKSPKFCTTFVEWSKIIYTYTSMSSVTSFQF